MKYYATIAVYFLLLFALEWIAIFFFMTVAGKLFEGFKILSSDPHKFPICLLFSGAISLILAVFYVEGLEKQRPKDTGNRQRK